VHADRISSALRARPELNLERVQGDERDAVILSIGYGKIADGWLLLHLGPLLLPGGHRRLNVGAPGRGAMAGHASRQRLGGRASP
jgi:hypothetical protein